MISFILIHLITVNIQTMSTLEDIILSKVWLEIGKELKFKKKVLLKNLKNIHPCLTQNKEAMMQLLF